MSARNTLKAKAARRVEREARHQRRAKIQKDQIIARVISSDIEEIIGFYKDEEGTLKYGKHRR